MRAADYRSAHDVLHDLAGTTGGVLVWHAFEDMEGGEIYVNKIPSIKVTDLARRFILQ